MRASVVGIGMSCLPLVCASAQTFDEHGIALLQTVMHADRGDAQIVTKHVVDRVEIGGIVFFALSLIAMIGSFIFFGIKLRNPITIADPSTKPKVDVKDQRMSWACFGLGLAMTMLMGACTDQYVPSMPLMAKSFGTTEAGMGISLQVNWICQALASLVVGPVSDRVGRKHFFTLGCLLLSFSSIACGMSASIVIFTIARAIQGVSEGCMMVVGCTYRDVYDSSDERARINVSKALISLLAPVGAPAFGQLMAQWTGSWRWCFILFGVIAAALTLLCMAFVDETLASREEETSYYDDVTGILFDREMMVLLLMGLVVATVCNVFTCATPFVYEEDYGRSGMFVSAISASSVVVGAASLLVTKLIKLGSFDTMVLFVKVLLAMAGVSILFALTPIVHSVWSIAGICWLLIFTAAPIALNADPLFNQKVKNSSGTAGGIAGCFIKVGSTVICHFLMYFASAYGAKALLIETGIFVALTVLIFYIGIGRNPPAWVYNLDEEAEKPDSVKSSNKLKEDLLNRDGTDNVIKNQ